jgi:sugar phosphate isomerase/epimerase
VNYLIWEETVRQMKECIEICAAFVEIAVVHPGHLSPLGAQMPDMAWKQMIEALRILCDFSAGYNITIALENMVNMDWLFGRYPHELLGIIETVNRDNICVAFDVGHANTTGTIEEFLHLEGIKHVHVHDNFGKKDDHLPLGSGNIDWEHVIGSLEPERMVIEVRSLEEGERSLNFLNLL